ncbi:hypothetical protein RB195_022743 [Necator americanus]|uniref:Endonuclease/exonuclease/phosphatase domain-containing protein n=1 Tax=Necator americanus TaxID=51031 RepID=A0ABR1EGP4_NECAM
MVLSHRTDIGQWETSSDRPLRADESHHCMHVEEKSSTPSGKTLITPKEQGKRKMPILKLQLDYVLTTNISLPDIRKSRAVWDIAFDSDHRPVLLSFIIWFQKRYWEAQHQPKPDMAALKDNERWMHKEVAPTSIS